MVKGKIVFWMSWEVPRELWSGKWHEPMYIFKGWLWLLVENKLLGAKVKTVESLFIVTVQAKGDGGLDQGISNGGGEK